MTATTSLEQLTASDLMTDHPVQIPDSMLVEEAADLLAKYQVSGAPVVDVDGKCVGGLSTTDLVRAAKTDSHRVIVAYDPFYRVEEKSNFPEESVRNWMTQDVVTVRANTSIAKISSMMLDAHIHRVIVVDEEFRPEGIVASTDILAAIVRLGSSE